MFTLGGRAAEVGVEGYGRLESEGMRQVWTIHLGFLSDFSFRLWTLSNDTHISLVKRSSSGTSSTSKYIDSVFVTVMRLFTYVSPFTQSF